MTYTNFTSVDGSDCFFYAVGVNFELTSLLMVNQVFLVDASYLGYIGMAVAVGSLIGAAIAARWSGPGHIPRLSTMLTSGILLAFIWVLSAAMPSFWLYALVTCIASIFGLTFMVTSNSLVVSNSPKESPGRIWGIYLFIFYIGAARGGRIIGRIAEHFGVRTVIFFGVAASLLISIGAFLRTRSLR
jgi:predicted MFS family arabinose efflux permease